MHGGRKACAGEIMNHPMNEKMLADRGAACLLVQVKMAGLKQATFIVDDSTKKGTTVKEEHTTPMQSFRRK